MRFSKVGQGGGEADGSIIETRIGKDGTIKHTVLGHTGEAKCLTQDDEALFKDLLETEVDGHYGDFSDTIDGGYTGEYFEEKRKEKGHLVQPQPNQPDRSKEMLQKPEDTRELDHGFGVGD